MRQIYPLLKRWLNPKLSLLITLVAFILLVGYQSDDDKNRSWRIYKADAESSSYSDLNQITTSNVNQLQLAWIFNPNDAKIGARPGSSECNPIIIDGILYATSARHRVYAVDAATANRNGLSTLRRRRGRWW
jgi:quinoprotein glucose dehydrogenase